MKIVDHRRVEVMPEVTPPSSRSIASLFVVRARPSARAQGPLYLFVERLVHSAQVF